MSVTHATFTSSIVCLPRRSPGECRRDLQQLRTIILLNIGALLDIGGDEWFEEFPSRVTIHIIDSSRPVDLHNLFGGAGAREEGATGPRVVVWDDGHADKLTKERLAFDAEEVRAFCDNRRRVCRGLTF